MKRLQSIKLARINTKPIIHEELQRNINIVLSQWHTSKDNVTFHCTIYQGNAPIVVEGSLSPEREQAL